MCVMLYRDTFFSPNLCWFSGFGLLYMCFTFCLFLCLCFKIQSCYVQSQDILKLKIFWSAGITGMDHHAQHWKYVFKYCKCLSICVMILHLRVPEINLAEIYVEQKPESTCFNFSFILLTLFWPNFVNPLSHI
jgi:hypothetical protein